MQSNIGLITLLTLASLAPFFIAVGTCFIKISIVLMLVRNAIGLQNVPSGIALNGVALLLSMFVMMPIVQNVHAYLIDHPLDLADRSNLDRFSTQGLAGYRVYLSRHARPALVEYFEGLQAQNLPRVAPGEFRREGAADQGRDANTAPRSARPAAPVGRSEPVDPATVSLFSLLPAYALTELDDAFRIGFYLYLPFVVIDLVVSSVLLALGMMMSPVSISIPIKLVLFIAMDGWTLLSRGLIDAYFRQPG